METKVIIWSFIIIFGISALLTLLGITGVIKSIKEKYLNALFAALILEVIAAVILVFKAYDFNPDKITFSGIIEEARVGLTYSDEVQAKEFVLSSLGTALLVPNLTTERDSLKLLSGELEENLKGCQGDLTELDNNFYTKVTRLRKLCTQYGGTINLGYHAEEKEEVYALMEEILSILGFVTGSEQLTFQEIRNEYRAFEEDSGCYEKDKSIISEFETTLMIRKYLNTYHPILKKSISIPTGDN